jgi:hypothetical protein
MLLNLRSPQAQDGGSSDEEEEEEEMAPSGSSQAQQEVDASESKSSEPLVSSYILPFCNCTLLSLHCYV